MVAGVGVGRVMQGMATDGRVQRSVYLPVDLSRWLDEAAAEEDRSFNKQVVRLLRQAQEATWNEPGYEGRSLLQQEVGIERSVTPDPKRR